jgi:hypothetical protein
MLQSGMVGPSTIDLTHDAEYGAPRLLVYPMAANSRAMTLSDLLRPLGERRCRRFAARTNSGSRSAQDLRWERCKLKVSLRARLAKLASLR